MAMAFFCASGRFPANALLIEQGALYPALFRLVRQGLLKASWGTSENNRRAKFYELTAAGRKRLQRGDRRLESSRRRHGLRPCRATGGNMRPSDSLRSFVSTLFQRSQIDAEMEEELRSHIQHRADDLERSGIVARRSRTPRAHRVRRL